jgi:hypothetical protein
MYFLLDQIPAYIPTYICLYMFWSKYFKGIGSFFEFLKSRSKQYLFELPLAQWRMRYVVCVSPWTIMAVCFAVANVAVPDAVVHAAGAAGQRHRCVLYVAVAYILLSLHRKVFSIFLLVTRHVQHRCRQ